MLFVLVKLLLFALSPFFWYVSRRNIVMKNAKTKIGAIVFICLAVICSTAVLGFIGVILSFVVGDILIGIAHYGKNSNQLAIELREVDQFFTARGMDPYIEKGTRVLPRSLIFSILRRKSKLTKKKKISSFDKEVEKRKSYSPEQEMPSEEADDYGYQESEDDKRRERFTDDFWNVDPDDPDD